METRETGMTSFDVALFLEGDGPSDFRFRPRNEPLSPWERRSVLASRSSSSLVVKVKLALAVHGKLSNGDPASLIIVDFDFISMSTPRRFKYAMVEFVFKPEKPGSTCPKLRSIAPSQYYYQEKGRRDSLYWCFYICWNSWCECQRQIHLGYD